VITWFRRGRHRAPRGPLGYFSIVDGQMIRMTRPVAPPMAPAVIAR
jgi:hypothetical protein